MRQPGRALAGDLEHRGGRVDPEYGLAGLPRDLDRDPARSDCELDDRAVRLPREPDVVRDVVRHAAAPCVVDGRPGVVVGHSCRLAGDPDELLRLVVERPPVEPAVERLDLEAARPR